MGRLRFVQPDIVRLALSDGDWIDIKVELTAGEEQDALARMTKTFEPGKVPELDPVQVQLSTLVAYLIGWSFQDAQGQPVDVTEGAIRQLDSETFRELHAAISAHERARDEKKKVTRATASVLSPTSP